MDSETKGETTGEMKNEEQNKQNTQQGEAGEVKETETKGDNDETLRMLRTAIQHLQQNSCLHLGTSASHGIGVFATQGLKAGGGTCIPFPPMLRLPSGAMQKLPSHQRHIFRYMFGGASDVIPRHGLHFVGLVSYLNHANSPNSKLDNTGRLTFLRDIAADGEVTIDYRATPGWEFMAPSRQTRRASERHLRLRRGR